MRDSNALDPLNLPVVVAGGGAGNLKGGRHITYSKDPPPANLHVTLLNQLAHHSTRSATDSIGKFDQLSTG
jgi:hypothetical protein